MNIKLLKLLLIPLLLIGIQANAQFGKFSTETKTDKNGYKYETVTNDPLNARIYTLDNGLKVYMTVYEDAPRVQTYIAVGAGSKNDPAEATGLAHYLEHIMFKGTSEIGTTNWEKEKQELKKIEDLYEEYRQTIPIEKREAIYAKIDSISNVAAQYVVANEYDQILSKIGATGTNAYTFLEETVYINNIPSNQIEKWAQTEAERFSEIVPRLFHTELEAVYEEKNKNLDSDSRKVWESMLSGLFPHHPYGTQTTIGTIEHLKNPSITEIKKYFKENYVPNNMAIALSGDFDPSSAIKVIDSYFGKLEKSDEPEFRLPAEEPITRKDTTVLGPEAEYVQIGFRLDGKKTVESDLQSDQPLVIKKTDQYMGKLSSMLLTNGQAGLIDLNLNNKQKVQSAYAYFMPFNDYSLFIMRGVPKKGQSLEEVKELLLNQVDSIKQGNFQEWLIEASVNDIKTTRMKEYESNSNRAQAFVEAFISEKPWGLYLMDIPILEAISKEDLQHFAKTKLTSENSFTVFKRTGDDPNIEKVPKPDITAPEINRDQHSEFYQKVLSKESEKLEPVFVDFSKELTEKSIKKGIDLLYKENQENGLFRLQYKWEKGNLSDPALGVATGYMSYLGTDKISSEKLQQEFYKLGVNFSVHSSDKETTFSLSGLNENLDEALQLFEDYIKGASPDNEVLQTYVERILKSREDNKKNKSVIRSGMLEYAQHGAKNPFNDVLAEAELKALTPEELISKVQELYSLEHKVMYYGPSPVKEVERMLGKHHKTSGKLAPAETPDPEFVQTDQTKVYFVDHDMVQAEVMFVSRSTEFDNDLYPKITLFNEYFGGSMGSLVFQEMRESRALAYSVRSYFDEPSEKDYPNYMISYIGTQADKLHDAIAGMNHLLTDLPEAHSNFENAKAAITEKLSTNRTTKFSVLSAYERARKLGLDYDRRSELYKELPELSFEDIKGFYNQYISDQPKTILIIGSRDRIDLNSLERYGPVKELTLDEIFGY